VSFSADSTQIVSGSYDKTVRIWNASSGAEVFSPLRGHEGCITSVVFSPDSTKIVSCSHDNTIRVWDVISQSEMFPPLRANSIRSSAVFSPDGCRIISKSRAGVVSWDSTSGFRLQPTNEPDYSPSHSIAVIPGRDYSPYWIEDLENGRTISNLPFLVRGSCSLSYENLLAVGTTTGDVFFMRFPPAAFNHAETRPVDQPRSNDEVPFMHGVVDQPYLFTFGCGQHYTYIHHTM